MILSSTSLRQETAGSAPNPSAALPAFFRRGFAETESLNRPERDVRAILFGAAVRSGREVIAVVTGVRSRKLPPVPFDGDTNLPACNSLDHVCPFQPPSQPRRNDPRLIAKGDPVRFVTPVSVAAVHVSNSSYGAMACPTKEFPVPEIMFPRMA